MMNDVNRHLQCLIEQSWTKMPTLIGHAARGSVIHPGFPLIQCAGRPKMTQKAS